MVIEFCELELILGFAKTIVVFISPWATNNQLLYCFFT